MASPAHAGRSGSAALAVVALVASVAVGCQSPPPSPSPSPATTAPAPSESMTSTELARGCWGVSEPGCGQAVVAAMEGLAEFESHSYGYASVQAATPGVTVRVILEPTDDSAPIEALVGSGGDLVSARETDSYVSVEPSSGGAPVGEPFRLELGHCGIFSGIDADGSFWDPVGQIDPESPDTINAAPGRMLITDDTAVLETDSLRLDLVRHEGAKYLPLCM